MSQTKIVRFLKSHRNTGFTSKAIAKLSGVSKNTVSIKCSKLVRSRNIKMTKRQPVPSYNNRRVPFYYVGRPTRWVQ